MSFLCINLLCDMITSSCVLFVVVLGLLCYHKDVDEPVPRYLVTIAECVSCRCCKLNKENNKTTLEAEETNKIDSWRRPKKNSNRGFIGKESHAHNGGNLPRTYKEDNDAKKDDISIERMKMTWRDVGTASDVVFFIFSLVAFVVI